MKRAMLAVAAWSVAACALGCTKGGATATGQAGAKHSAAEYYPLAIGNRWTYEVALLGSKEERTVEILKRSEGGFVVDNQGQELMADAFGVRDQKRYLLQEPIQVGTSWTNVVSVSSIERYKIVEAGKRCEVPAGKFEDCVTVESTNKADAKRTLVNEMTFAPGVGIVAIKVTLVEGNKQLPQAALALKSFELKGAAK